ncbi:MAG TPA: hypothetical protein VHT51_11250 [Micropepsaceae bacterium]|nr:hypothetical protein [Micropepsaceae bacterium]
MRRACIVAMLTAGALGVGGCALDPREIEPYREVSCFEAAKVSLRDAVEAAEIEGGKAIDAAYREVSEMGCLGRDPGYYDVTVLIQGKLSLVSVNAASEQIQPRLEQSTGREVGGQFLEHLFEGSSTSRIPVAERIKIHLHDAIEAAEKTGGKAMEARAETKNGKPGYAVKLVELGKLHMAWVDGG